MKISWWIVGLVAALVCLAQPSQTLSEKSKVAFTPHNFLGAEVFSGSDSIVADYTLCRQCHTPSKMSPVEALWYRQATAVEFKTDTTLRSDSDKLLPADEGSRTCLACHDGSIATGFPHHEGSVATDLSPMESAKNRQLHLFTFHQNNTETHPPAPASPLVVDEGGQISCSTCHDPHNNEQGKFLREATGELCGECHDMANWDLSTHGHPADPRFAALSTMTCTTCHDIHAVPAGVHLLKSAENTLCLGCHDGRQDNPEELASAGDLVAVFDKPFVHPIRRSGRTTTPASGFDAWSAGLADDRTVACSDCHNPHAASDQSLSPFLSGAQLYVSGVDSRGFAKPVADYEYETCYKCHGLNQNMLPGQAVGRLFARTNMSFHPVETPGNNPYVPSLKPEWSEQSMLRCTDCHGNADPLGPAGPHGSDIPHILKAAYADFPYAAPEESQLCFRCHEEQRILQSNGFKFHQLHIQDAGYACSACHDPHGSIEYPGLMDLNKPFITPLNGVLEVVQTEPGHGTCTLKCHAKAHPGQTY